MYTRTLEKLLQRAENNPDLHLRGHVLTRNKDAAGQQTRILKRYTFSSMMDLHKNEAEIEKLCRDFNARFYVNPTLKSYESIAYDVLQQAAVNLANKNYKTFKTMYDSVADANTGVKEHRLWMLDVDCTEGFTDDQAESFYYYVTEVLGEYLFDVTVSKSGLHVLFKPHDFKLDAFVKHVPKSWDVSLKKNSLWLVHW